MMSNKVKKRRKRPDKRAYWAVVMWGYDLTDGGVVKYKPSIAHIPRACETWEKAIHVGLNMLSAEGRNRRATQAMPTFIITVIHQEIQPDISADSPLRLFVNRIPLDNDLGDN